MRPAAESPTHKGYERVKAAKGMIRDGSSRHSLISFCYLDWSPELARKYREDDLIASQKKLPPDAFRRQYLGIWTIDGTNFRAPWPKNYNSSAKNSERRQHPISDPGSISFPS
jgi:hypothetical protein